MFYLWLSQMHALSSKMDWNQNQRFQTSHRKHNVRTDFIIIVVLLATFPFEVSVTSKE